MRCYENYQSWNSRNIFQRRGQGIGNDNDRRLPYDPQFQDHQKAERYVDRYANITDEKGDHTIVLLADDKLTKELGEAVMDAYDSF